ncbi:MAG: AraC family transcriptional regulator [bacterium]|nr:AraC family transcriptional regulator [bacterium]
MIPVKFKNIISSPEDKFRLTRLFISPGDTIYAHSHDFAEINWMDSGEAQHVVNGETVLMRPNHLVMIRKKDKHEFRNVGEIPFVLVSLAFREEILRDIRARYFPENPSFFGGGSRLPRMVELDGGLRRHADELVDLVLFAPRTQFYLDLLILNLLFLVENQPSREIPPLCPAWLKQAYSTIQNPELLNGGVKNFQNLCGKSATHVSRACRKWLQATPSEVVNRFRMEIAARELAGTERPIVDICLGLGFDSLSHFYSLFKQRHGVSPRQYRLRNRAGTFMEG